MCYTQSIEGMVGAGEATGVAITQFIYRLFARKKPQLLQSLQRAGGGERPVRDQRLTHFGAIRKNSDGAGRYPGQVAGGNPPLRWYRGSQAFALTV